MPAYEDRDATLEDRMASVVPFARTYGAKYSVPVSVICAFINQESGGLIWIMNGGGDGRADDWMNHGDGGTGWGQMTPPYHIFDHQRMISDPDYAMDQVVAFIADCLRGSGGDVRGAAGQYGPHNADGTPYAPYGDKIVALAAKYAYLDDGAAPQPPAPVIHPTLTFIDIRDQLETNPSGGPARTQTKVGAVQHWNGPPVSMKALDQIIFDATYHIHSVDWGGGVQGDGLMYHLFVGDETGDGSLPPIYLCRNLDAVLWHCASWADGGNGSGFAVSSAIGQSDDGTTTVQHLGPGQLQALAELHELLRTPGATIVTDKGETITIPNSGGYGLDMVRGHQELSSTSCPGSEMADLILPLRAGTLQTVIIAPPVVAPVTPLDQWAFNDSVTRHYVGGAFARVWTLKGGLGVFGHPLSEEYQHADSLGTMRTCQLFEKAQFFYYPEFQGTDNEVQFANLGVLEAHAEGITGTGIQ